MSDQKNSLLNSVGKAESFGKDLFPTGKTIAVFEASQVPVGTELFVRPSDSRLTLEVSVANDNAQHWQQALREANAKNSKLRQSLNRTQKMLRNIAAERYPSPLSKEIMEFLEKE